jgi:hypothetical protein
MFEKEIGRPVGHTSSDIFKQERGPSKMMQY